MKERGAAILGGNICERICPQHRHHPPPKDVVENVVRFAAGRHCHQDAATNQPGDDDDQEARAARSRGGLAMCVGSRREQAQRPNVQHRQPEVDRRVVGEARPGGRGEVSPACARVCQAVGQRIAQGEQRVQPSAGRTDQREGGSDTALRLHFVGGLLTQAQHDLGQEIAPSGGARQARAQPGIHADEAAGRGPQKRHRQQQDRAVRPLPLVGAGDVG